MSHDIKLSVQIIIKKYRGSLQTKGYKAQTLVVDKILYYIFLVPFQLCYWTIPLCTGFLNCKMSIIAAATSYGCRED